jgi:sec-independent protein translocase protein TatA
MVGDILQPTHLLFILVVALLVLGPKRLPEVGRSLGSGLRDFRGAMSGEEPPAPREVRPTPEYVHAPPQEPLAPIVEPEPVQATVVEHQPQTRSSDPIA